MSLYQQPSFVQYTGNGALRQYAVPFPYLERSHVFVTINGVEQPFTWVNDQLIELATAPANGVVFTIRRRTPSGQILVDFEAGSALQDEDLDLVAKQALFVSREALDIAEAAITVDDDGALDALNRRLKDLAAPTQPNDAARKADVDNLVAASGAAAAASALAAQTSATASAASALAAQDSATASTAAANSAAATLDAFDDRYLGEKTSLPTLDNDGNALVNGTLVSLTGQTPASLNGMYVRRNDAWTPAIVADEGVFIGYRYIATAAQTTFSGADADSKTMSYVPGALIVAINGAVQPSNTYTATNGTSVVFGSGLSLNDIVTIHTMASFSVADTWTKAEANALYAAIGHVGAGGAAHANATTSVAGFLSATDKTKLDAVPTPANIWHTGNLASPFSGDAAANAVGSTRPLGNNTGSTHVVGTSYAGSGLTPAQAGSWMSLGRPDGADIAGFTSGLYRRTA